MKITVIGAGNSGLAFCAHLCQNGHDVTLWNRSKERLQKLLETRILKSVGKVEGSFQLRNVTLDLQEAVSEAELIVIATPQFSQQELAEKLRKIDELKAPILLSPGGIFGVLMFDDILKEKGTNQSVVIGTQTVIYTSRNNKTDEVNVMGIKSDVPIAGRHYETQKEIFQVLPEILQQHVMPERSLVVTSISDVNMIVHCAPVLLNTGWIESDDTFLHYRDGISPSIARFITKVDNEKIELARRLGYNIESTYEWYKNRYNLCGENLYECVNCNEAYEDVTAPTTLQHRYLYEDLQYGLVAVERIGKRLGLDMKYTSLVIDLGCALLDVDFRKEDYIIDYEVLLKYIEQDNRMWR